MLRLLYGSFVLVSLALAQQSEPSQTTEAQPASRVEKADQRKGSSAGKDIGSGAGNIATGTAKGAGDAAKGAGKGAVDLVTLHPINAASAVGKGAVSTGKDVGVGTAKGTGKIARGVGKAFKKLF
jgi:hypothetical protein